MDRTIVGLVGAIAALVSFDTAQANTGTVSRSTEVSNAKSYEELLNPIPNAVALLHAAKVAGDNAPIIGVEGVVQTAYHHHHHKYARRRSHHHHHHRKY
jgi:hypothetical protein